MAEAGLARFIDRYTVQYVRDYPHPIERVWRALTDPAELGVWCMPATIDLRVGGAYAFQGEQWGHILALDPPRLIRLGKKTMRHEPTAPGENWMQYELETIARGTRMTFSEHWQEGPDNRAWFVEKFGAEGDDLPGGPDSPFHPGTLGGWHGMFEDLGELLDGEARRRGLRGHARWVELTGIYREHIRAALPSRAGGAPRARWDRVESPDR